MLKFDPLDTTVIAKKLSSLEMALESSVGLFRVERRDSRSVGSGLREIENETFLCYYFCLTLVFLVVLVIPVALSLLQLQHLLLILQHTHTHTHTMSCIIELSLTFLLYILSVICFCSDWFRGI